MGRGREGGREKRRMRERESFDKHLHRDDIWCCDSRPNHGTVKKIFIWGKYVEVELANVTEIELRDS